MNKVVQSIKNNYKDLIHLIIVSIFIAIVFIAYLVILGIPKTKARNYYNKGKIFLIMGDKEQAREFFDKARNYWDEKYIREDLEKISY